MVWQYIYFSTLIKKGTFTYSDSNPRDSRNQKMWRWCSQIASDYMKSRFNPLRLVSAPPPPFTSSAPSFSGSVLIASLVNLTRGTQGCPKIISFDKSNWHPNFWRVFFSLLFLCCLAPVHFRNTLCQKMHSLLHQSSTRESFSRSFFRCSYFTLSQ